MATTKVFQAAVYIGTLSTVGLAKSANIPAPTMSTGAHETISTLGTVNLPTGFDAMEGSFTWQGMSPDLEKVTADVFSVHAVQVRFNLEIYQGTKRDVGGTYFMNVRFRSAPNADFSAKADVESETAFDVLYIRKEIGGRALWEYDPVNYIYKVNGRDMLAAVRANLGMV